MNTFTRKALALVGCVALTFAALLLWNAYHDVLAGASLMGALCCSVLWNDDNKHTNINTDERN